MREAHALSTGSEPCVFDPGGAMGVLRNGRLSAPVIREEENHTTMMIPLVRIPEPNCDLRDLHELLVLRSPARIGHAPQTLE